MTPTSRYELGLTPHSCVSTSLDPTLLCVRSVFDVCWAQCPSVVHLCWALYLILYPALCCALCGALCCALCLTDVCSCQRGGGGCRWRRGGRGREHCGCCSRDGVTHRAFPVPTEPSTSRTQGPPTFPSLPFLLPQFLPYCLLPLLLAPLTEAH